MRINLVQGECHAKHFLFIQMCVQELAEIGHSRPLIAWVNQCFPGINTRQVVPWAGLRPMMPNMMPRVGRGKLANVFYNTGHGHLGWTLSAVTADMLGGVVQGA